MFTGIVREAARVESKCAHAGGERLVITVKLAEAASWQLGDSIAINGVCLTIVANEAKGGVHHVAFDVSPETLHVTTLGDFIVGDFVNVEPALKMGEALGGHWVMGHVDGTALCTVAEVQAEYRHFEFRLQGVDRAKIAPYMIAKGSVTVNGVSLTINRLREDAATDSTFFAVMCIPHTLAQTTLGQVEVGDEVNVEADLVGKYAVRQREFAAHV